MKALLSTVVVLGMVTAEAGRADPTVTSQSITCEYRPRVDGKWESRGFVEPQLQGLNLSLLFKQGADDFGPYTVSTTGNPSEHRVDLRCAGSITLTNNKPFKIRDFKFVLGELLGIGSSQGKIELKVLGKTTVISSNQTDGFEKLWTIGQADLNRPDILASKQESNTVCGQNLTLRFDELRGTAVREKTSFDGTEFELQSLDIAFDPC